MQRIKNSVLIVVISMAVCAPAFAESLMEALTEKYTGPTVEDQIALMDKDKNGFADVYEVRAYLELQHGKGYEKELLDRWEASASGKSCSTPFAKELYSDTNYNRPVKP